MTTSYHDGSEGNAKAFFGVVDWQKRQHYGDRRNPPWIKQHTDRLDDPEFAALPDDAKAHVYSIELLAARLGNRVLFDEKYVRGRIGAHRKVNLSLLLKQGFIEILASGSLAECEQGASLERKNKTDTDRQEADASEVVPTPPASAEVREVFEYWQLVMGHPDRKLTPKRARAVKARLKDGYAVDDLKRAIDGNKASKFHQGDNDRKDIYDDLELICRNGENVEKFKAKAGAKASSPTLDHYWTDDGREILHGQETFASIQRRRGATA